jgi:hypothetical protein
MNPTDEARIEEWDDNGPDEADVLDDNERLAEEVEYLRVRRDAALVLLDDALEDLAHAIPYAEVGAHRPLLVEVLPGEFRRRRALLSPAPTPAAETPTPIEETDHG